MDRESVYLGAVNNDSWTSNATPPSSSSVRVGGVKLSNPRTDLKLFSTLWKIYSSFINEGTNV